MRSHHSWCPFAIVLGLASMAAAQCPAPAWIAENQIPGVDGPVNAVMSWDPDGTGPLPPAVVVAGDFQNAGGVPANRIAMWDGSAWQPLGAGLDQSVGVLTEFQGMLVAGGEFTASGSIPLLHVACWNGYLWQPIGVGLLATVTALTVDNGTLYAGGNFPTSGVDQWNGFAWVPVGSGEPVATSLCSFNGNLIATRQGGVDRWTGLTWQTITPGYNSSGFFECSTVHNGQLVVAGNFNAIDGVWTPNIASWNGTTWAPLGQGLFGGNTVNAVCSYNGDLIAGVGSAIPGGVYRWNGTAWNTIGTGIQVAAVAVWGSELVAGGAFQRMGTVPAVNVAHWNGASWSAFGYGLNGPVNAFTTRAGDLILAGQFTAPAGVAPNFDVVQSHGAGWQPLGTGMDGVINALAVYNGDVIAAGSFQTAGGVPAGRIARWTGSAWAPLGLGMNLPVEALAVYNGQLIAAGQFTMAGGAPRSYVAAWNGTQWLAVGSGTSGRINSLAVYGSELIAGGPFVSAQGATVNGIARWNGLIWQPLGSGLLWPVGSPGFVPVSADALAVYNGELIVGGGFGFAGGMPANRVARWNGVVWQTLGSGIASGTVRALTTHGGALVAATQSTILGWNGAAWSSVSGAVSGVPEALASWSGALFVGGAFLSVSGVMSPYLARYASPLPITALSQPSGPGTGLQVSNHWLVQGHEYFNVASLNPCASGPGTGPYGGLCFSNVADLIGQLGLPIGTAPFHFVAGGPDAVFGPFSVPPGLAIEALSVDVTGGTLGCLSTVVSYVVN